MPDTRGVGECRSCWRTRLLRPRNVCWSCYYRKFTFELTGVVVATRPRFPPAGPRGNRYGDRKRDAGAAAGPAIPAGAGREERVRILAERVRFSRNTRRPDDTLLVE